MFRMGSFPIVPSTGWNPGSQDTIMIVITQLICTICYADLYTYWESSCLTGLYNIICRLVHLTVWLYCYGHESVTCTVVWATVNYVCLALCGYTQRRYESIMCTNKDAMSLLKLSSEIWGSPHETSMVVTSA